MRQILDTAAAAVTEAVVATADDADGMQYPRSAPQSQAEEML
jgi:hypothetical protein